VARARTLSVRGREAYEAHEWERSLQAYAEAYAAMPLPAFLFNIAQAHRQQGRLAPARLYYQRYLQEAQPEGAQRELVSGLIAEMAEQERRSEVGQAVAAVQHGAYGGLGTGQARPVWEQWWFWAGVTAVVVGGTVLASTASGPAASPGRTAPVRPALSF
jgi:tetratricopeptide (TPR) repeat protein